MLKLILPLFFMSTFAFADEVNWASFQDTSRIKTQFLFDDLVALPSNAEYKLESRQTTLSKPRIFGLGKNVDRVHFHGYNFGSPDPIFVGFVISEDGKDDIRSIVIDNNKNARVMIDSKHPLFLHILTYLQSKFPHMLISDLESIHRALLKTSETNPIFRNAARLDLSCDKALGD